MNRWKTGAGDNKRQRGRGRKPSNPSNRSYESNGPEVKIRGNAPQIFDKYVQLARDASLAGDRVRAENLYQHAEHYFRLIQASQPKRDSNPDDVNEGDEDDGPDVADDGYERFSDRVEERDQNNQNNNNNNGGDRNRDNNNRDNNNRDNNRGGDRNTNRNDDRGDQNRNREPRRGRQPRQPRNEPQGDPLNVVTPQGEAQPQPQAQPDTGSRHPIHAPITPSSVAPTASENRSVAPEAASDDEAPRRARRPRRPRSDEGETGAAPAAPAAEEAKPAKAPRAPRASRAKPKDDTSGGGSESDAA